MIDGNVLRNLSVDALIKKVLENKEAAQTKSGALVVYTGKYTGRSPNDKFIVDSPIVHNKINWGKINLPISSEDYKKLYKKISDFFSHQKEVYVVDCLVGAQKKYQVKLRVYCQYAYEALFATHLFRRPTTSGQDFKPDLTLYCAPSVAANPTLDSTNSEAFIVLNIDRKTILIGGLKYAGEIKKSVFTYMNYLLPQKNVFPMHCSANIEKNKKTTALFFGLSGTGKTTLSADPNRHLIGDDEHGWSENGIFNFEGGCYAKCIRLKKQSEPQIWSAIQRRGALLENVVIKNGQLDFNDDSLTENTRAVYPLNFVKNSVLSGTGGHPRYVIFLTADASGVLPLVTHLSINQACYQFLSGYTSKLAGTERGVKQPLPTFSAFFAAPFMPLKPVVYLNLLKKYLKKYHTQVYLVNTGWVGGPYGVGQRIPIKETRKIVNAILTGKVNQLKIPHPVSLWKDKKLYSQSAKKLAKLFKENFQKLKIPDKTS